MNVNEQITAALEPTRNFIIASVKQHTLNRVALVYAKLEAADWDLKKAFPLNYNSYAIKVEREANAFAKEFTRVPDGWVSSCRPNEPQPRLAYSDKQNDARAQTKAEKYAAELLTGYAAKLTKKVADFAEGVEVVSCEYKGGGDPWGHSFINVKLANGNAFTLKTQIILNVSKLGTLFNQFPTRLVK